MHDALHDERIRDVESSRLFRERRKLIFKNFSKIFKMVTRQFVSGYRKSIIHAVYSSINIYLLFRIFIEVLIEY